MNETMDEAQTAKRPNILFFFTDDQRFDTIHALGNEHISTPNLDWLVAHGTAFTNAYIMGGTSGAVCMPSRAMLWTGRTLFHIQEQGQDIARDHIMLGETLQAAGYTVFGTGKWHNGPAAHGRNFSAGAEMLLRRDGRPLEYAGVRFRSGRRVSAAHSPDGGLRHAAGRREGRRPHPCRAALQRALLRCRDRLPARPDFARSVLHLRRLHGAARSPHHAAAIPGDVRSGTLAAGRQLHA